MSVLIKGMEMPKSKSIMLLLRKDGTAYSNGKEYEVVEVPEQKNDECCAEHSCFSCANSFVDDEDNLHCMADGHNKEETVEENYSCADWNR